MARRSHAEVKKLVKQVKELMAGGKSMSDACKEVGIAYSSYYYAIHPRTRRQKTRRQKTRRQKNKNRLPAGRSASYGKDLLILVPLGNGTTRGFTIKQAAAVYDYLHLLRHTLKDAE